MSAKISSMSVVVRVILLLWRRLRGGRFSKLCSSSSSGCNSSGSSAGLGELRRDCVGVLGLDGGVLLPRPRVAGGMDEGEDVDAIGGAGAAGGGEDLDLIRGSC